MAQLIPQIQLDAIRAAIGTVTDQFFTTPVTYMRYGVSLDPNQEDQVERVLTQWDFVALVTPVVSEGTQAPAATDGARENNEVVLTVNMKDLKAVGGIVDETTWEVDMDPTRDYFALNGSTTIIYRVLRVTKHGPLTVEDVLVKITGRIEEKATVRANA